MSFSVRAKSFGNATFRCSSQSLTAYHSSALNRVKRSFIDGDSATFTSTAGRPNSRRRSATPAPRPMESTYMLTGRSLSGVLSQRSLTRPVTRMRSASYHSTSSSSMFSARMQNPVGSPPRPGSTPQTRSAPRSASTSRPHAPSISSFGMTVSDTLSGNSPKTL